MRKRVILDYLDELEEAIFGLNNRLNEVENKLEKLSNREKKEAKRKPGRPRKSK